jgi:haloacetate dehalogenase
LWGAKGSIPKWYDAAEIWQRYASGPLTTGAVPSGHYLAEEAPEAVLAQLEGFLSR